jgi:hypothetical protein
LETKQNTIEKRKKQKTLFSFYLIPLRAGSPNKERGGIGDRQHIGECESRGVEYTRVKELRVLCTSKNEQMKRTQRSVGGRKKGEKNKNVFSTSYYYYYT